MSSRLDVWENTLTTLRAKRLHLSLLRQITSHIQVTPTHMDAHNLHDADSYQHCRRPNTMTLLPKSHMTTTLDHFSHREGQNRRPTKAMATTRESLHPGLGQACSKTVIGGKSGGRWEGKSMFNLFLGNRCKEILYTRSL